LRLRATDDRRQVLVKLTRDGEEFLKKLSLHHLEELQAAGPKFVKILQSLIESVEASTGAASDLATKETKTAIQRRKDRNHG
jgi:DNA-binding MarR family transcriptional regulator